MRARGAALAQQFQLQALELVVHDAGAVPQQHVGAGLLLDVAAQVPVGRPQDLLALRPSGAARWPARRSWSPSSRRAPSPRRWCWRRPPPGGRGARRRRRANSSAGQPRSSEQVASRSGISTRLSGDRILALSPMKRTPATTSVCAGWSRPKRAISSESATHAAGLQRQVLQVAVDVVVRHQHRVVGLQQRGGARLRARRARRRSARAGTLAQAWAVQTAPLASWRVKS